MPVPIRLIEDKSELHGTCYFEFLPGSYQGKCWNEQSVFLAEEVFSLIEPVIQRQAPDFSHYAFLDISKERWMEIIRDLRDVRSKCAVATGIGEVREHLGFLFAGSEASFTDDFLGNAQALVKLIDDLIRWLAQTLEREQFVAILGI